MTMGLQERMVLHNCCGYDASGWIMRCVTWRAVLAQLKTGMCEMKSWGLSFCGVSWDVGSGPVYTNAQYNLESCSGTCQKMNL